MREPLSSEDDSAMLVVYGLFWAIVIIGAFTKWRLGGRVGMGVELFREVVAFWSGVGKSLAALLLIGLAILTAFQAVKVFG